MLTPIPIARSGFIASGNVGHPHISSGAITSGQIGITAGTPTGTNFLRDDFTWASPGAASVSSGAVTQTTFASGAGPEYLMGFVSGLNNPFSVITQETISGVRAVSISQSGNIQIAMAGTSGKMPAVGVVFNNVASGIQCNVYTFGDFQFSSGLADYSGYVGRQLFVGRSGQIVSASGSFNSGGLLSGDVTQPIGTSLNSGAIQLAVATNLPIVLGLISSGMLASGNISQFDIGSGAINSGQISSGAVQGFFGGTRNIASGTVGVFDLGSGAVIAGTVGSGAVQSGNIASGQVGPNALASGIITSGNWIGSGTILGHLGGGPFHIVSGSIGTNDIGSGGVQSGNILSGNVSRFHLSSGCVNGALTASQHIASGTVGAADIASGAIRGNATSIVGKHLASGTIDAYNLGSGCLADWSQYILAISSGLSHIGPAITQENISGVRAVSLSLSGTVQVAMASVVARMPAIGIVYDNVASGIPANVFVFGQFQFTSGMADYSGYLGQALVVGRSGQLVTTSGSWNSGGLLSGDVYQSVGYVANSGSAIIQTDAPAISGGPPVVASGGVGSGAIASGAVQGFFGPTRDIASGTVGVFDFGSGAVIAGTVGSGAIVSGNIASGQIGNAAFASGSITSGVEIGSGAIWGRAGVNQFMIASGTIANFDIASGGVLSGNVASGQLGAFHHASGFLTSGPWVGSGAIWGRAGVNQFMICSGTIGQLDLSSGIITSGVYVGSGTIMGHAGGGPFQIVSGSITTADIGSGAVNSGQIGSGQVGDGHFGSGAGPQYLYELTSGLNNSLITEETVSGVRAVCFTTSGHIKVAMASQSGRMPAVGIVFDNVASGIQCNVFAFGNFTCTSGLADYSGYLGQNLWVGRSGQIVTTSGSFNSGGLLSGDVWQPVGTVWLTSGGISVAMAAQMSFIVGQITSGNIASGQIGSTHIASGGVLSGNIGSGQIGTYAHASGTTVTDVMNVTPLWSGNSFKVAISSEAISGIKAVCVDITNSGSIRTAMAATSGRMPAIGVVADNILSGIPVNVITMGYVPFGSGIMGSGYLQGMALYVGASGDVITLSGGYGSGGFGAPSGMICQRMGQVHFTASGRTSGAYLINTQQGPFTSGIASGANYFLVMGFGY